MNISEEHKKEIKSAMNCVWDCIAPDMLRAIADADGESNVYKVSMPRAEVIDVLLDQTYGRWDNCSHPPSAEATAAWRGLSHRQRENLMRMWFSQKTYGY